MSDWIGLVIRDCCEIPYRFSPEDMPDAMVVKPDELREFIERHADQRIAELEASLATARRDAWERAARLCERRAEERFAEHGIREYDTNAAYYSGRDADWHQAQDEEDENCAAAIRALQAEPPK